MLRNARKEKEIREYQKKINELQLIRDSFAKNVSEESCKLESIKSEIETSRKQIEKQNNKISELQQTAENINNLISLRESEYKIRLVETGKVLDSQSSIIVENKRIISEQKEMIKNNEILIKDKNGVSLELINLKIEVEKENDNLKTIRLEIERERNSIIDERKLVAEEIKTLSQLVEYNGKTATLSEKNLGLIQLYAKRLQRYYDKGGVRLNVLKGLDIPKNL
ncbi:hypothetical protein M0R04_09945 [Candidatus Dojkabacteria bacterium]|jgi:hypothetical protein|nr:hypothetical protein [Candidatus Dojkabacteria bacterium]